MNTTTLQPTGKALLTLPETADMLGMSNQTLRRHIAAKRIAVCKPGGKRGKTFIRPADIDAFLLRSRRAAIGE